MTTEAFEYCLVETRAEWLIRKESSRLLSVLNTPDCEPKGSILFLPSFGTSLANLFIPAFGAASIGMRTLRFDGRDNVGVSAGGILDYRLGTLLEDARLAAKRLAEISGADDFIVVGMSISAAVALKLASEYPRAQAVLIVPAIDVCRTVDKAAKQRGLMDLCRRHDPEAPEITNVFGHPARVRQFSDDLVRNGFGTVEEVLAIAEQVRGRGNLILAELDEFVQPERNRSLIEALDALDRLIVLEKIGHDFGHSATALKTAFDYLIRIAQEHFEVPADQRAEGLPPEAALVKGAKGDRTAIQAFLDNSRLTG